MISNRPPLRLTDGVHQRALFQTTTEHGFQQHDLRHWTQHFRASTKHEPLGLLGNQ